MHAIEEADGQADFSARRLQFARGVDYLHPMQLFSLFACGQCVKRDDALLQLRCSQLENIFEWNGIGGVKLARSYSSQRRQMRAAAQFFPKFMSEAAHIGSLRACNPEPANRLLVSAEAEAVNMDQPRLPLHLQAFAREFIQRHSAL